MDILSLIVSVLGVIGTSSIISGLVLRRIDRLEKMLERRDNDRVEENVMRGEVIDRAGKLAEANTVALRVVTSDDVCLAELLDYRKAHDRLEKFMREKSAEYLHAT